MAVGRRTRGNSKVELNDSPEIPDRRETLNITGLHSGVDLKGIGENAAKRPGKAEIGRSEFAEAVETCRTIHRPTPKVKEGSNLSSW